jgi:23S rRNA (pseudouridine1915-N3)-methyltransferase
MQYRIISVGKLSEPFYRSGVEEYLKRLIPYGKFELVSGFEKGKYADSEPDIRKALEKEGEKIHSLLPEDELAIGLDSRGRQYDSLRFAEFIRGLNESSRRRVSFVIGSSEGLADSVKQRLDDSISFSRLTFPHQMAVLILTEQLYRAFRILRGEPYHK